MTSAGTGRLNGMGRGFQSSSKVSCVLGPQNYGGGARFRLWKRAKPEFYNFICIELRGCVKISFEFTSLFWPFVPGFGVGIYAANGLRRRNVGARETHSAVGGALIERAAAFFNPSSVPTNRIVCASRP